MKTLSETPLKRLMKRLMKTLAETPLKALLKKLAETPLKTVLKKLTKIPLKALLNLITPLKTFLNMHKDILYKVGMVVCVCVFVFSTYKIGSRLYGYYHDNKQYEEIRKQVESVNPEERFRSVFGPLSATGNIPDNRDTILDDPEKKQIPLELPYKTMAGSPSELNEAGILKEYAKLVEQNNDMVGWIHIPGYSKVIDYPVMQSEGNNYYLNKDFYGNYSYAGSIFMDFRNNRKEPDRHIIIYGHAMNDYSMFGNLKEFPDKPEQHTKNTKIYLDLLDTRLEYEIFSTYYCKASDNYRQIAFQSDNEFMDFLELLRGRSVYDYGVELSPLDRIITLSTCNNSLGRDIRCVIHGRLVRRITYDKEINNAPDEPKTAESSWETALMEEPVSKKAVSANVYLLELSLTYGDPENPLEAVLDPPFSTVEREFSTMLPLEAESVRLTARTADPEARMEITLNDEKADPDHLKMQQGENIIKIKVISRDWQYARTYTLTVLVGEHLEEDDVPEKDGQ